MTELYISAIEADISTVEVVTVDINHIHDVAIKLTQEEDVAYATLESSEIIDIHPALELDMSSIKEGFKKAIEKILDFFKWIGEKVANIFNKIIEFFKKVLGIDKKERIKKKAEKVKKEAKKVHEAMKEDAAKVKEKVKEEIDNMDKEKEKELINLTEKTSTLFIGVNKLTTDTIAEYSDRVLHQIELLNKHSIDYLEFSNAFYISLDDSIKTLVNMVTKMQKEDINAFVSNKAKNYVANIVKDMNVLLDKLETIDKNYITATKNIDKFTSAVRSYLNIKDTGINILLGDSLLIYSRQPFDKDKLYTYIERVKTVSQYDVKTFASVLSDILAYYTAVFDIHFGVSFKTYPVELPDKKKAVKMIKEYIIGANDVDRLTSVADKMVEIAESMNDSNKDLIKMLDTNRLIITRDAKELTIELKKLLKITDREELRDLNAVIASILKINRLLTISINRNVGNVGEFVKLINETIKTAESTLAVLTTTVFVYSMIL